MSTAAKQIAEVNTKSSNVGASLAGDPEDAEVAFVIVLNQTSLVNRADAQLLFYGRNKGRALKARSSEGIEGLFKLFYVVQLLMQLHYSDVLFTSGLLSLDKSCRVVNANEQTTSNLGI